MKKIVTCLFLAVFLVVACSGCSGHDDNPQETDEYKEGNRAYKMGVSAEANPYTGRGYEGGSWWLKGWMDAKEKDPER